MTSHIFFVTGLDVPTFRSATQSCAPTKRLAQDWVAVAHGDFDLVQIGGFAAWLGSGCNALTGMLLAT